jgi:hypothetical protein
MLTTMSEKSNEKKGSEDTPEELLKTKHGMYASRAKDKEANSENAPDEN